MKKPLLYRSVNTRTHGVRHGSYCAYRYERNPKFDQPAITRFTGPRQLPQMIGGAIISRAWHRSKCGSWLA
jgi:hypothetical protein